PGPVLATADRLERHAQRLVGPGRRETGNCGRQPADERPAALHAGDAHPNADALDVVQLAHARRQDVEAGPEHAAIEGKAHAVPAVMSRSATSARNSASVNWPRHGMAPR